jgi:Cu+-exporting ATPase
MKKEIVQFKVSGLMCSFCTMSVETALKRYSAVKSVMVNLVHGIVLVEADTTKMSRGAIADAIEKLGYNVSSSEVQQYNTDEALFKLIRQRGMIGICLAVVDLLIDPVNVLNLSSQTRAWVSLIIASFILMWVGFPILRKTIMAIRGRVINANVLLSAGAWGSYIVGILSIINPAWPNFLPVAAWLMALHLFFGYFKLDTRKKASDAVRKLLSLQPPKARVMRGDETVEVPTAEVVTGETLQVRPGERIPLDGIVLDGSGSVDESGFTGESNPAYKGVDASVIGGTLNLDGSLRIKVTRLSQDSFLSQIVRLMTQIAERKPPIELLADKLMNYYGPVVFAVAGIAFTAWLIITGNYQFAILVLLTTVIMGYPCALGITTPMLAAIAGGKGISIGLLVKASEVFYGLSKVNTLVFDKTGTLTHGKPTVTDHIPFNVTEEELLSLAGSVEENAEHPLAQAIHFYCKKLGISGQPVSNFKAIAGRGVLASIATDSVIVGSPRFAEENEVQIGNVAREKIQAFREQGKTAVVVARNSELIGLIALLDTPRPGAAGVIKKIKAKGYRTVMLTGDSAPVATAVAAAIGVDLVKAELLPQDKVSAVVELQSKGSIVAMVGDGINDAPALAQADVGIAIGAGTDVAIESAGVILISDKLIDVLNALILGRASYRIMTGNVILAVIFNIVGMLMAAFGLVTPMLAVIFMIISIFAILFNTLRVRALRMETVDANREASSLLQVDFKVNNMVCEGCAEKITSTLSILPGVERVQTKVMQKKVTVQYRSGETDGEKLNKALAAAGYQAIEN